MYLDRSITNKIKESCLKFPVVTIIGPRQSGKTTLLKNIFPKMPYVNLESLSERNFATDDPVGFLKRFPRGAILDEIQNVPDLVSEIQVLVDREQKMGMFLLTGSQNFSISQAISQSLAGRTSIFKLLPLSLEEVKDQIKYSTLEEVIFQGQYPQIFSLKRSAEEMYSNYIETYIERDIRKMTNVKNLNLFRRFMQMLAGRSGQLLNKNSLSNDIGVSAVTIEEWITLIEASFVGFRLRPWFSNIGKRLTKSPKFYFYDTGLLCHLLEINTSRQLLTHPLRGQIFENFVIVEVIKFFYNNGKNPNLFFYRDSHNNEVDLLIQQSHQYYPIEIKSSQKFSDSFLKGIKVFQKLNNSLRPIVILGSDDNQQRTDFDILSWRYISNKLKTLG